MRSVVLLLGILLATTSRASDNVLVGTWVSPDGARELAVHAVGENSLASGWYCFRVPGVYLVTDFHGYGSAAGAVAAHTMVRLLFTRTGSVGIRAMARPDRGDLQLTLRGRSHRTVEYEMRPGGPADAPCGARILPPTIGSVRDGRWPAGATVADRLAAAPSHPHPFVGSWTGERDNGLVIELNVTSVADGLVRGLYCNISPSGWRATDMDWAVSGAIHATATPRTLRFEYNDRDFSFTLDESDQLNYVQTRAEGHPVRTVLVRVRDPVCARRVIARPGRLWPPSSFRQATLGRAGER